MTTSKDKATSAKQVAIDVLRDAGEPLRASEIAKRVLASGRCAGLKGKTPEATISAMLAVGSKPGGHFKRVDKGTYTLADAPAAVTADSKHEPATTKQTPASLTATTDKSKSASPAHTRSRSKRTR